MPHGTEIAFGEDRGDSRAFAHAAVDAGADLVVGSGPHVIRGVERYHGRVIAYSLGNFAGWNNFGLGGPLSESAILRVRSTPTEPSWVGAWFRSPSLGPGSRFPTRATPQRTWPRSSARRTSARTPGWTRQARWCRRALGFWALGFGLGP